jgi:hypothetical protein
MRVRSANGGGPRSRLADHRARALTCRGDARAWARFGCPRADRRGGRLRPRELRRDRCRGSDRAPPRTARVRPAMLGSSHPGRGVANRHAGPGVAGCTPLRTSVVGLHPGPSAPAAAANAAGDAPGGELPARRRCGDGEGFLPRLLARRARREGEPTCASGRAWAPDAALEAKCRFSSRRRTCSRSATHQAAEPSAKSRRKGRHLSDNCCRPACLPGRRHPTRGRPPVTGGRRQSCGSGRRRQSR